MKCAWLTAEGVASENEGNLREERDLLGLAHAPDRCQGIVGRRAGLSEHAARDDRRAKRYFHRWFRRRRGLRWRWRLRGRWFGLCGDRPGAFRSGFRLRRRRLREGNLSGGNF